MGHFGNRITKDRKLYGNCQVLSPDGKLMFRCNEKKIKWYLSRDLADIVDDSSTTIRLKFTPRGLGNHTKKYGLEQIENRCVCCGTYEYLTRHHVVPQCYRKHLPLEIKSHNYHDVLSLCIDCHESYEESALKLKMHLSDKYNAPMNGEFIEDKELSKIKKLVISSTYGNLPRRRRNEMRIEIRNYLGVKRISKKMVDEILNRSYRKTVRNHGEIVISKIDDTRSFIIMWRKHFLENMECKYLPKNWSIFNE